MGISEIIKQHTAYTSAHDVAEICHPLFSMCNLNYFDYAKIYHDGSLTTLLSNHDWFHHYFTHEYPISSTITQTGIHLWEHYLPQECLKDMAEHFNFHNGITIFQQHDTFIEFFDFGAPANNPTIIDYYFNHLDILNNFLFYFKDKAASLIKQADNNRITIPKKMHGEPIPQTSYKDFCELIQKKKIHLYCKNKNIVLTQREYEVLLQLTQGKTAKETAKKLNISHRTVEDHLTKIKNKSGYAFKSQLIEMFRNNLITTDINV